MGTLNTDIFSTLKGILKDYSSGGFYKIAVDQKGGKIICSTVTDNSDMHNVISIIIAAAKNELAEEIDLDSLCNYVQTYKSGCPLKVKGIVIIARSPDWQVYDCVIYVTGEHAERRKNKWTEEFAKALRMNKSNVFLEWMKES